MATGDTYADLGTTFKYAAATPATDDQTGYGALTWVAYNGAASISERGDTVEDIAEPLLADGRVEHFNGQKDGGILEIPTKHIEGDTGQAAMLAAAGSNTVYSFQEVDPDGEAHFYQGRVKEFKRREATPNTFKGYTLIISVNTSRFTGTEES